MKDLYCTLSHGSISTGRVFEQLGPLRRTQHMCGVLYTPPRGEAHLEYGQLHANQQSYSSPPEGSSSHRHNGTSPFERGEN